MKKEKIERLIIFIMANVVLSLAANYTDLLSRITLMMVLNMILMWALNAGKAVTVIDAFKVINDLLDENDLDSVTICRTKEDSSKEELKI